MEYKTEVQRAGRITLPASLRKDFGITIGDTVTIVSENGQISLMTQHQALNEARELLRQHAPQGIGGVDEFLEGRRKDALAEEREHLSWKAPTK